MAVGLLGDGGVVGDQNDGGVLRPRQAQEFLQYGRGVGAVQRPGRFVREDHGRSVDQGPCHGDALTLPARHLGRAAFAQLAEPEPLQHFSRRRERGLLALPGQAQRQRGVLLHGQLGEQFAVLEDEAEALAAQRTDFVVAEPAECPVLEPHLTACGGQHARQAVQQRGLAGTALPGDGHDLAAGDREVGVTDGQLRAVGEVDSRGTEYF